MPAQQTLHWVQHTLIRPNVMSPASKSAQNDQGSACLLPYSVWSCSQGFAEQGLHPLGRNPLFCKLLSRHPDP